MMHLVRGKKKTFYCLSWYSSYELYSCLSAEVYFGFKSIRASQIHTKLYFQCKINEPYSELVSLLLLPWQETNTLTYCTAEEISTGTAKTGRKKFLMFLSRLKELVTIAVGCETATANFSIWLVFGLNQLFCLADVFVT